MSATMPAWAEMSDVFVIMGSCCSQVVAKDLFYGQAISNELYLRVCEHKEEQTMVIVGCQ